MSASSKSERDAIKDVGRTPDSTGMSPIQILDRLKTENPIPMPSNDTPEPDPDPLPVAWRFSPWSATLTSSEVEERLFHLDMPKKFEVWGGALFYGERQRLHVLAMMVEALDTERVEVGASLRLDSTVEAGFQPASSHRPQAGSSRPRLSQAGGLLSRLAS